MDEARYTEAEVKLQNLEAEIKRLRIQQKRLVSHFQSEQRVYNETGKRVDQTVRDMERVKTELEKHDSMLRNNGTGLMFRVAEIQFKISNNKETLKTWMTIAALLLSLGKIIIDSLHK